METSVHTLDIKAVDFNFGRVISYLKRLGPHTVPKYDPRTRSLQNIEVTLIITKAITIAKAQRVQKWPKFCEGDADFRWLKASVSKSYRVTCDQFEVAEKAFKGVVATLRDLWKSCAESGDQCRIIDAMDMEELRLRPLITRKETLRKRKRDQKDEASLIWESGGKVTVECLLRSTTLKPRQLPESVVRRQGSDVHGWRDVELGS